MKINAHSNPIGEPSRFASKEEKQGDKTWLLALRGFLTRYYGWILTILGAIILVLQTIEHTYPDVNRNLLFFDGEVLVILLLLGTTSFLTRMLLTSISERDQALNTLRLKHDLGMHLAYSINLAEISQRLVEKIALIVPSVNMELYLYDEGRKWFSLSARLDRGEVVEADETGNDAGIDPGPCHHCMINQHGGVTALRALKECRNGCAHKQTAKHGYCLPLAKGNASIGLLMFYMPTNIDLTQRQIEMINSLSSEISSSLFAVMKKNEHYEEVITQKTRALQMDIARDLHDTIGQNIGYLRMKLDYLSENPVKKGADTTVELKHMSDVANESYDMMRGTLAVLQSGTHEDFVNLYQGFLKQVAERAGLEVDFAQNGEPRPLPSNVMRQLFFIFREAIGNIEKHANATKVHVNLTWGQEYFSMSVTDNGRGFDVGQTLVFGHYGLRFMQERTRHIKGKFSMSSARGEGTSIVVQVPYNNFLSE